MGRCRAGQNVLLQIWQRWRRCQLFQKDEPLYERSGRLCGERIVLIVLATVVVQIRFACGYGQRLEDLIVDPQCDWEGEPSEGELLAVGLHQSAPFGLGEGDANRFEDVQSSTYGEIAYASLAEALRNPLVNSSGNFVDLGSGTGQVGLLLSS